MEDYEYLNHISLKILNGGYLGDPLPNDAAIKQAAIERLDQMITEAEKYMGFPLPDLRRGARLGWFSPASPVWANYAHPRRGLPISCNGSFMADDMDDILFKVAEIGAMTKRGAGTSLWLGELREFGAPISTGGTASGPTITARLPQEVIQIVSQAGFRRGNCAVWIGIDHPEIDEWMKIRSISGEGKHHPIQHLSFGVTISDKWLEEMNAEPKGGPKRKLMARIRNKRRETGFPYIMFEDNANKARPEVLKQKGLRIKASNLCTEIMLPSSQFESFVCNLSSGNLRYYRDWKGTNFIREMIFFLDAVMEEYIRKTDGILLLSNANRFARRWRALGLGTLGYHSLLQSESLPFASDEARALNIEAHEYIQNEATEASRILAKMFGEPEGMEGTGFRNLTRTAIAPTTSSSLICGQDSQSIEPWDGNIFENDNAKGAFIQKNKELIALLDKKGLNTPEMWDRIAADGGSVRNIDELTDHEKEVFLTFGEIDQYEILRQTRDRGQFVCQGQSLNVKMPIGATMKDDIDIILAAHAMGLKSLYYRKGYNKAQEVARKLAEADCVACEA